MRAQSNKKRYGGNIGPAGTVAGSLIFVVPAALCAGMAAYFINHEPPPSGPPSQTGHIVSLSQENGHSPWEGRLNNDFRFAATNGKVIAQLRKDIEEGTRVYFQYIKEKLPAIPSGSYNIKKKDGGITVTRNPNRTTQNVVTKILGSSSPSQIGWVENFAQENTLDPNYDPKDHNPAKGQLSTGFKFVATNGEVIKELMRYEDSANLKSVDLQYTPVGGFNIKERDGATTITRDKYGITQNLVTKVLRL